MHAAHAAIHNGDLWFLEAGKGYLCRIDLKQPTLSAYFGAPDFCVACVLQRLRLHLLLRTAG